MYERDAPDDGQGNGAVTGAGTGTGTGTLAADVVAPIAVVGASYRDCSTEVRARLAALEHALTPPTGPASPSRALLDAGYASGVVVLETCSRVEWIVSSTRPRWAADLLRSTLLSRVPEAKIHGKAGHAGAHYLLRLAMGLDSVAEGEPAVGRQLVLAFERAHKNGGADRALRLAWRAVQHLLGERRRRGVVRHGLGVQTLVVEELGARLQGGLSAPVAVLGQGEIGRAVVSALREAGYTAVEGHKRDTMAAFMATAERAAAVVVCTGGPAAFLELPERTGAGAASSTPLAIDIGVPEQIKRAPGWTPVPLEALLAQPRRLLDDDTRLWLVEQIAGAADGLSGELLKPPPATALAILDEERRVFMHDKLPPLLEKLPADVAEEIRRACSEWGHRLMERVRDEGKS